MEDLDTTTNRSQWKMLINMKRIMQNDYAIPSHDDLCISKNDWLALLGFILELREMEDATNEREEIAINQGFKTTFVS